MNDYKDLVIAHLSDLHLSSQIAKERFKYLEGELKEIKPSIVLITGDLVDDPDLGGLLEAKNIIESLKKKCEVATLALVPGNHDYRWKGIFTKLKKRWRALEFLGWKPGIEKPFQDVFGAWGSAIFLPLSNIPIAIFCLDSNSNDATLNFARGRVGQKEYSRFDSEFSRLEKSGIEFKNAFKIVLLHHHPLPIAGTEFGREFHLEPFMILDDAGTFIGHMFNKGIDLILHGHKHCPNLSQIKIRTPEGFDKEISVLGAGSATSKDPGPYGNSYNLITLRTNGTVQVEQKHLEGTRFKPFKKTILRDYEKCREQYFESSRTNGSINFDMVADEVSIDSDGDANFKVSLQGCQISNGTVEHLPRVFEVWEGGKCIYLTSESNTSFGKHPNFLLNPDSTDQKLNGILKFDLPLSGGGNPQNYELHYLTFNAFALTREQRERMYGEPGEEFRSICITEPTKYIKILTHFAEDVSPERFSVKVLCNKNELNLSETEWCQKHLHWSQMSRTLSLEINKPLFDHEYRIVWDLPRETEERKKFIGDRVSWQAEKIKRDLLKIKGSPEINTIYKQKIQECLGIIRDNIFKNEKQFIDIGIMVFDEEIKKLTPIVGLFPKNYWEWNFYEGQGLGGRAHKLNRAQLYVKSKTKLEQNYYASPPSALPHHQALLSIPMLFPLDGTIPDENKIVLGVLSIGSHDSCSLLCQLWNDSDSETIETLRALIDILHNLLIPLLKDNT